jgi:hypothetical protein
MDGLLELLSDLATATFFVLGCPLRPPLTDEFSTLCKSLPDADAAPALGGGAVLFGAPLESPLEAFGLKGLVF